MDLNIIGQRKMQIKTLMWWLRCKSCIDYHAVLAIDLDLDWKDPLEERMATHSSILAWRIPMNRGAWQATIHGVTESLT